MGKKTIDSHVKQVIRSRSCNPKESFKTYNEIGAGEYGKVYKACINDKCLNKIAVKNSTDNMSAEYLITKKLEKLGVPQVYGYDSCGNREFLFSEFIHGVTLKSFLRTKKRGDPAEMKSIIAQTLFILYTIHKKYPTFRHHDVHLDNVMLMKKRIGSVKEIRVGNDTIVFDDAKLEVKLMDFGLATVNGVINPIVKRSESFKKEYGIFPGSHDMYDVHLFLSSLYASNAPDVRMRRFIEGVFTPAYLAKTSEVVNNFRLRPDVTHALPSFEDLFADPYFSSTAKKAYVNTIPAPVKKVAPLQKKKSPVNQNKAKQKAVNVLKKIAAAKKAPTKAPTKKKPSLTKPPTKPMTVRESPK